MSPAIKTAFRPAVEAVEGRLLATAGLTGQSWVDVEDQTGRNLAVQVSFNEGRTYSTVKVEAGGATFAHVERAVSEVLIKVKGEPLLTIAPGPFEREAAVDTITPTVAGGPAAAPPPNVSGGGGALAQAYVVLLNQSGQNVTLSFTNNNGKNFLPLTIGTQYFNLRTPYVVSLDQTSSGIKIRNPNGVGLQTLSSSPTLGSAPVYIINASLSVFKA